ncbi:MAG: adenine phosphoribosyltransferase [Candidatus Omnitrophica bacterium]|nr:adenine phosphoribosyltransferase [Candidatus Omnitrophota bacterium]HOX55221.1 adenine phosphoribosyltransferase [Candidatus Omnitrophota bacterium]
MKKSDLKNSIRTIPDFPKAGILFRDITTLLKDKDAFKKAVDLLAKNYRKENIDTVVAVESRGFIFGAAVAYKLKAGFVPVRKKGKLPSKTISATYNLEYGTDTLEMHEDAIPEGARVLIIDDLLATGGTVKAVTELINKLNAKIVGIAFLIELKDLKGKNKLKEYPLLSIVKFKETEK